MTSPIAFGFPIEMEAVRMDTPAEGPGVGDAFQALLNLFLAAAPPPVEDVPDAEAAAETGGPFEPARFDSIPDEAEVERPVGRSARRPEETLAWPTIVQVPVALPPAAAPAFPVEWPVPQVVSVATTPSGCSIETSGSRSTRTSSRGEGMVMPVAIPDPPHSPERGDPLDTNTATAKLLTPVKPIQPESESQSRTPRFMVGSGFDHFGPVEAPVLAFAFRLAPREELRPSERKTHGFESQGTGPTARQTLSEMPDRAEPSWERPAERERDRSEIQQEHPPKVRSAHESEASHHPLEPVRRVSTPAAEPPPIPVVRSAPADHTPVVRDRVEEHPVVISVEEGSATPAVERVEVVRSTVERGAVRELVLSVPDANARPEAEIELRFAERQGEIEVAVYGSDAEQSAQVKSELEQLTARLEGAGFGVETDSLSPERESTRGEMPGGERGRDGSMPFNFDDRGQRRGSRQLRQMWLNRIWEEAT